MKDRVIFYYEKNSKDVFGYFPESISDRKNNKLCYSHVGQHSACSPGYAEECVLANRAALQDLKKELIGIGYNLDILNEKEFEYYRNPTPYEIRFGEGAIHYKSFSFEQVYKWKNDTYDFKKWIKCPVDGLRYYQ